MVVVVVVVVGGGDSVGEKVVPLQVVSFSCKTPRKSGLARTLIISRGSKRIPSATRHGGQDGDHHPRG